MLKRLAQPIFKISYSTAQESAQTVPRGRLFFVTLRKSKNHVTKDVQASVKALQLAKVHQIQVHRDTPTIRGLIYHARHLLTVKSVSTATLFPQGTEDLQVKFEAKRVRKEKIKQMKKATQQRKIKRFAKMITSGSFMKIPKLRKRPSRTHL